MIATFIGRGKTWKNVKENNETTPQDCTALQTDVMKDKCVKNIGNNWLKEGS